MKLVELECKNCGAPLKIEEGTDTISCPYCKATYKLDDEAQHIKYDDMENTGYEFEKGRIKAQKEQLGNNNIIGIAKFPIMIIPIFIIVMIAIIFFATTRMNSSVKSTFNDTETSVEEANKKLENEEKEDNLENERFSFNFHYSNGSQATIFVKSMLNDVITSNKTNERIITVKFNDITTQDTEQILEIEKQLERYGEYDVILDYDEDGFVNVITIK